MGAREVTANAVPVATLIKRVPSAVVVSVVMTANAAKSLRDAAVVASVVERQLNASVMNTNAATVATLSSKLVDAVTTRRRFVAMARRLKPQRRANVATARRLKLQRRVNAVTTRRLSNQMPQKSLSQSVARRSLSKSKILIN